MRKICSWRLSRIEDASAWKRLSLYKGWMFLIVLSLIIGFWALLVADTTLVKLMWWGFGLGMMFSVYAMLKTLLGADESFCIQLQTMKCCIYVYNRHGPTSDVQDIIFRQGDTEAHVETKSTSLKEKGYRFREWKDFKAFMYCLNGNNKEWFYLSPYSNEPQFLGEKVNGGIGNSVFLTSTSENKKLDVCVLDNKSTLHIQADSFVIGMAYVPPFAQKHVMAAGSKMPDKLPEEYLIVKDNGKYQVYGIEDIWADYPQCRKLNVPTIIFQEKRDRVILQEKNGEYKELYRMIPATRWINEVIAELSVSYDGSGSIGGTVWKFDEQTGQLQKLYEGVFHGLGFADGHIIGDDWTYAPTTGKGYESN